MKEGLESHLPLVPRKSYGEVEMINIVIFKDE